MPQVKIKQGTKSSINNNAGILNAGTLAITTDSNELFVTHNDGTVHQLCDNVNKSGDTMTGNLNMSGNSFENGGFEVLTSLPTTNNFVGRQVTYEGRSYIWNGSAWKCDSDYLEIGGRNYIPNSKIKALDGWGSYYSILSIEQNTLKLVGNNTYVATYIYLTENLEIDKEVTLCFEIKNNKANSISSYFWVNGNGGISMNIPGNSGWVRFNETFIPAHHSAQQSFSVIFIGSYGDSDFQIRNVKLEKGNIATDWTPAPEDKLDVGGTAVNSEKLDGKDSLDFFERHRTPIDLATANSLALAPGTYDLRGVQLVPGDNDAYWTLIQYGEDVQPTTSYRTQVAMSYTNPGNNKMYRRTSKGAFWTDWVNVADGGNADKLDNYHLGDIKKYIASRGENLITNGSALMGNNLNFPQFTFDGSQAYYSSGSFKFIGAGEVTTDELMPVNPNIKYKLDFFAKSLNAIGRYYAYIACYDVDGLSIDSHSHMYLPNTLTTLAQPLNNGDTIVYLTSAANWDNTGINDIYSKSFIFWDYVNSFGYLYPPQTYSRHYSYPDTWANGSVNTSNNTITLKNPWSGGTVAAGTQLSNGNYGSTYKYLALGYTQLPTIWTNYNGVMDGVDLSGQNLYNKFPPGTAAVRVGFLMDWNNNGETAWFTNLSFAIDTDVNLTLNFDTNNIEPTQTGTVTKTSTWTWQYLVQSIKWLRSNSWIKSGSWIPTSLSNQSATRLLGITSPDSSAEFGLAYLNGKMYPYTDGKFYQNEGAYEVLDTSDINGTQNYLTKYGATGITQSNIFDNGTNVGIGTANPAYGKLNINTNVLGANDLLSLTVQDGVYNPRAVIRHFTSTTNQYVEFTSGYSTSSGYAKWIFTNGNVGIGTTNPVQQLDITGSFNLPYTTPTQNGIIYKSNIPFIHNFNYGNNGTVTTDGHNTFIGINAGNFTMGSTASATHHSSYNTGIGVSALQANTTGSFNSAIGMFALHNNTTGSFNSAIGMFAGRFLSDGTTGSETGNYGLYLGYDSKASANGTDNEIVIGANAIGKGSNTAAYGNSSMVKHIFEAGSVGIGTMDPQSKLEIYDGDLIIRRKLGGSPKISFITNETALASELYYDYGNNLIRLNTNSGTGINIKGDTGNVGINTLTPSEKFEVAGTAKVQDIKVENSVKFVDTTTEKAGMRYNTTNKTIEFYFN